MQPPALSLSPPPPLRQYMLLRSVHRVTVRTEFREGGAEELKCWTDPDSRRGAFFPHLKCSFLFRLPGRGAEEDLTFHSRTLEQVLLKSVKTLMEVCSSLRKILLLLFASLSGKSI